MKNVPYILKKGSKSNDPASPRKQELGEKAIGKDGTFTFDIQKDDELILYNIPAGTKYEVTEDTLITENGDYRFDVDSVNGDPTKKESSGTIAATGAANKKIEISFVNNAKEVALVKIPVTKTMTGRDFNGNEQYQFTIESVDPNAPMPENSTITLQNVSESGTATPIASDTLRGEFGPIEFNQSHVGTRYQYTVTEKTGNVEHVEYSKAAYTVNVTVSQDVTTGKLKAESTITDAADNAVDNPRFINDYIQPINVEIPIQKNLEGRDPQTGDEFFFKIEDADNNNPRPVKDLVDKDIVSIQSTTGQDAGSFEFKHLDRTMTGQYKFKISEVAGSVKQLAYDTNVWLVNMDVELIDNKDGGKALNAHVYTTDENANSVDLSEDKPLSFTNTYQATGQLLIPVTKTLKGRQFVNGDRFLFEITGENGAPMPAQTILSMMPTAGEQVTAEFAPILYTEANVGQKYVYQVQEISTGLSGMKYDTTAYTVNVEVSKADKEIVATATYTIGSTSKDKIEFTNDYEPEATLAIPVTKVLTGRAMTPEDKFVFNLEAITQDAPMPEHQQVTIQGNGQDSTANTQFDPIVFESKHAGKSYEYQVTEHRGSINNIEYSGDVYTVNVKVEKDEKGQLTVKPTYFKGDVDQGSVLFTNKYQPSGSWRPMLTKQLLGTQLEADAFAFNMTVTDSDGTVIYNESAQNNQDGTINFKLVTFAKAGRYTAVIQEVKPQNSGDIEYDPNELTYTLDVTDDNGKLVVNELTRSGRDAFVNDAGLRISKQLIAGTGQTLEDADKNYPFPFELDLGAAFAKQTLEAKRIQADGTKKDESLGFDEQGKAKFNLKSDETLIVYGLEAGTPYVVTELTQNNWIDNYLQIDTIGSASGTMSSGVDASVTFRNLKPSTDNAVIHGFKTMSPDGDPFEMKEGTFQFEIRPAGSSSQTATRSEQPNDVEEEPLDESYEVHRSTLPAFEPEEPEQPEEEPEEQPETEPADNEETPAPIDAQLKRKLKLTEREAEIMPASETPLPAKTVVGNNAFGRFEFGEITYTKPGTYVYEILEQNTGISGMTYDRIVFKAIVTVEEWNNSTLKVKSIQYTDSDGNALPNNTMLFTNQYEDKENEPKLTIHKEQSVNFGEFTDTVNAISVDADDVITYKLTVTNSGTAIAKNVVITDVVPAGLILLENSLVDATVDEKGLITWELGDLGVGASRSVTFQVRVPKVDIATTWTNVAHVQGDDQPEKPSNPVSDQSEPGKPEVTIHKYESTPTTPMYDGETPPLRVEAGELVTYDLVVTNEGNEAATEVVVTDIVPKGLEFVQAFDGGQYDENTRKITWNVGTLAANGGTAIVSFQVKVPVVDKDTAWKNTATLTYKEDPEPTPSNTVEIDTIVPAVILEKEHKLNDGDRVQTILNAKANDTVTYYLKATNTSLETAHDVWIKDTIPETNGIRLVMQAMDNSLVEPVYDEQTGTMLWKIGDLQPGESKEVWFRVQVPSVKEKTKWTNVATVSHEDNPNNPENPDEPREEIETPPVEVETNVPSLRVVKRQAKNDGALTQTLLQAKAGDKITYAIDVTNDGVGPASQVVIEDIVPEGLELVKGSISDNGVEKDGRITWKLAKLEAGQTRTVTFQVQVPSVKTHTRWTNVASTYSEDDPDPKTTPPVEVETFAPHLTIEKSQKRNEGNRTKDVLAVVGNDRVTYFIKVTSDGEADATDVVVTDAIPEGLTLLEGSVSDEGLVENGQITWHLGTLKTGTSRTVSFAVDVPEAEGVWRNIAEVVESTRPDEPTPSNEVEIKTPNEGPRVTIEKLQAKNDGQPVKTRLKANMGDTITYILRIQNHGTESARQIQVKDAIPDGLRFVEGSITRGGTIENKTITWKIDELKPDETIDLTFQVKVPVVTRNSAWINVGVLVDENGQTPSNEVTVTVEPGTPASSKNGKPTSPKTATQTNQSLWIGLLMSAMLVLAGLWVKRKKTQ
ncbi:Spy0128 family protein [uncultured Dubosiella sp.]|uniref:Spy0128 family protein n=1 Tax=uncultured Dubosiella sp. TaxID=1937011 RepID=UPI002599B36E|nr:FctA domain-containing protein [uncultured Dubosiella sp.]